VPLHNNIFGVQIYNFPVMVTKKNELFFINKKNM